MTKDKFTSEVVDTLGAIYERGFAAGKKEATTWIPVNERLPEKNGNFLTVDEHGYIHIFCFAKNLERVYDFSLFDKNKVPGWYDYDSEFGFYQIENIVAWMPLPEPYKGVEE